MSDLNALISQTEQKYGLPAGILAATAQVESHGNPGAVSPQGAEGVMQLLPSTAHNLHADPFNVPQAVDAAGRLWSQNLKATGGDIDRAAMMYHGGTDPRNWGPKTHAYPAKLAAALGPEAAPQQSGDPIEAALSGGQPSAPQTSAPAQGGADPIEAALQGGAQSPTPDFSDANLQMKHLYEKGAKTADIVAFGQQHGLTPNADQIEQARKQGFGTVNFALPDPNAQPQQPQTSQGLGFYQGLVKPLDNAATWLEEGADKIGLAKPIDALGHALGLPTNSQAIAGHQAYIKGQEAQGQTPGAWGQLAGSILSSLPIAAVTKNPAVLGGISSALDSDNPNDIHEVGKNAIIGAIGGKLTDGATNALSGVIAPKVSAAVQKLNDLGVAMTPGQIIGGALKRMEDGSTSLWGLGDVVKNAQRRSAISLNTSVINDRVLSPIGKALPNGLQGREAVDFADREVSKAYHELLPQLKIQANRDFYDGVKGAMSDLNRLPADRSAQVRNIVKSDVLDRFNPDWSMSGDNFKEADEALGALKRQYSGAQDPDQRQMGQIFGKVQGELRAMLERANPDHAEQLGKINQAFANLVRVEGAAASAGAKGGIFTPAQLGGAVRRYDTSVRKKGYATGNALLQDVSDAAQEVLPSSVPDSGTPYRTIGAYLLGGGLSAATAAKAAPLALPLMLYTKTGQKAFQKVVLAPRGAGAQALAKALTKMKAPLAVAGGAASAEATHAF